jgi:hypothetical protein
MIGLPVTACPEPVEGFTAYLTLCALRLALCVNLLISEKAFHSAGFSVL